MATGTITRLLLDKGYGFITPDTAPDGSTDLFFHRSAVADEPFEQLQTGQHVRYTDEPDARKASRRRAVTVSATDA
jgi:cold shock CspA family protein